MTAFRELLNKRRYIYALLLGALFLPVLLTAGGCTEKDREMGPAPEPSAYTVKYYFQQEGAYKVSAAAVYAAVAAYDAGGIMLDGASLLQTSIADMPREDGYIVAEAVIPEEAVMLVYTFSGEAPGSEPEFYAVALKDGQDAYIMSDDDALGAPELFFYVTDADQSEAAQKGVRFECTVGDELYPDAKAVSGGGLEVPVTVLAPVDENVVAYTPASETGAARYVAQAEGETAFVLNLAGSELISEDGVAVKAAPPTPTPTPSPTPTPEPSPSPSPEPSPTPSPEPSPTPTPSASVNFLFELAEDLAGSDGSNVGITVKSFKIVGYTDAECTEESAHGPWLADKDGALLGAEQTVELTDVPLDVVCFRVSCLADGDSLVSVGTTPELELAEGEELNIIVKNDAPLKQCSRLTLDFNGGIGVPTAAAQYRASLYDVNGDLAKEALTSDIEDVPVSDALFDQTPLNTSKAVIEWLDEDGRTLGGITAEGEGFPQLTPDQEAAVNIADWEGGSAVTLRLTNAYAMDTEKVTAQVRFSDGTEKEAGTAGVDFDKAAGSCEIVFKAAGGQAAVSSVTLLNGGIPFEWLDYAEAQESAGGSLNLDVNGNEFANGAYAEGTTMLVANPRHLDNVRSHLEGKFEQIADIDFAGSCGIRNTVSIVKRETGTKITAERTDTDTKARFYGKRQFGEFGWFYGWLPIGGDGDVAGGQFLGKYNGGGHTIANAVGNAVDASDSHAYSGLFGCVGDKAWTEETDPVKVENVKIADSCSFCSSYLSALVCKNYGKLQISGCESAGEHFSTQYSAGMLAEMHYEDHTKTNTVFSDCKVSGRVSGKWCGGILSYLSYGTVSLSECVFDGELTASENLGGMIYWFGLGDDNPQCTIKDCKVEGTLSMPLGSSNSQGPVLPVSCESGGLIGTYHVGTLKLEGKNTVSCVMEYSDSNSKKIGGVVGFSELSADDLKNIFRDHETGLDLVTVSEGTVHGADKGNEIGTYCGKTWVNGL